MASLRSGLSNNGSLSLGVLAALGVVASVSIARRVSRKEKADVNPREDSTSAEGVDGIFLSTMQLWFLESTSKGIDHIVASVELSAEIPSKETLESAIEGCKRRDPNLDLAVAVVGENQFRLQKTSGVCGMVEVIEDEDWRKIAHQALNSVQFPKPTDKTVPIPTWKVQLVKSTTANEGALIIAMSHVMFDGTSRNRLIRAILENLDWSTKENEAIVTVPITSAKQITRHTQHMSWWQLARQLAYTFQFRMSTRSVPAWVMDLSDAPGKEGEGMKKETRQLLVQLSPGETLALTQRCKQEQTSVHGALSAATLLAQTRIRYSTKHLETTILLSHLISLWINNRLGDYIPPGSLTGSYVSFTRTTTVVDTEQQDAWSIARNVMSELRGNLLPLTPSQYSAKRRFLELLDRQLGQELCEEYELLQRIPTVAISNNGRVNVPVACDKTQVQAIYATSARHDAPGNLAVLNVQTVAGKLCIALSYYSHVWQDETAREYLDSFVTALVDMST